MVRNNAINCRKWCAKQGEAYKRKENLRVKSVTEFSLGCSIYVEFIHVGVSGKNLGPVAPTVVSAAVKLRARMGCTIDVLRHVPTVLSYALHLRVA